MCVCLHFVSCTLAKRWCIRQPVNVYTNCLKRYLICGWLYRSQHDKFKKHGFELKFLFSIFSKLNQIKINKAGVKLQAYVTLQILCNPWIQSKIRRKAFENVKIWKQLVFIFFSNHCKPSWMAAERYRCYFNIFSPSVYWDNYSRKKKLFSKLHDKYCQNWQNLREIVT